MLRTLGPVIIAAAMLSAAPLSSTWAGCENGERVDGTTADTAAKKILGAGYQKPTGFKKGCDSVWHAVAQKNGAPVRVAVSPQGGVMEEKD